MRFLLITACSIIFSIIQPAKAVVFDFEAFTAQGKAKTVSGLDLSVDVTLVGESQIRFEFFNEGSTGIVKEIAIEPGVLSDFVSFDTPEESGIEFQIDPHPKKALKFLDWDQAFCFSAKPSAIKNGIGPGESLALIFDLQPGKTFSDVISGINSSDLRIGTDVHGVPANTVMVNAVPEPASLAIIGLGYIIVRRFKRIAGN